MEKGKRQTILSIGVLASDRKDTIRKCLSSLDGIRNAIPCQLIVTDTGCSTEVRRVLEEYADIVTDFVWCNDFAAARNENLRHADGEWYMYLDDDEWFADIGQIIDFFRNGANREADAALYTQRNYINKEGTEYNDYSVCRIARRVPGLRFHGIIHEYFEPVPKKAVLLNSYVEHYGYIFERYEDKQRHFERNSRLLEKMTLQEPENQYWWIHLAQEYISMRDYKNMWRIGEKGLQLVADSMDKESVRNRGTFYMSRILSYVRRQDREQQYEMCREAIADERISELCRAYVNWWMAHASYWMRRYREAENCIEEFDRLLSSLREDSIRLAEQASALIVGQCCEEVKYEEARSLQVCAELRQNKAGDLAERMETLDPIKEYPFFDETIMSVFFECDIAEDDFIQIIHLMRKKSEWWIAFAEEYTKRYRKDHTRADKIRKRCERAGYEEEIGHIESCLQSERKLLGEGSEIREAFTTVELEHFSRSVLSFYEDLYGTDFREREELPGKCLMALLVEEALKNRSNKKQFLGILKQIPAICPEYREVIEKMAAVYQEEIVLSIGILASDRPGTIRRCLESLRRLREEIVCELIITDTGCSEPVRLILEEYADTLSDFIWCDDFSAARNENLSHASGQWYMFLDDDECLVDDRDLIEFFVSGNYKNYDSACYVMRDYQNVEGTIYSDSPLRRLAKRTKDTHFEGKVHEYLVPQPVKSYMLSSVVEHHGYAFADEKEKQAHFERNHRLILEMIEKEPYNLHWKTHLAQEYLMIRDFERLRKTALEGLEQLRDRSGQEISDLLGSFYLCKIVSYEGESRTDEALEACEEAFRDNRCTPLCIAFVHWWKAQILYRTRNYAGTIDELKSYLLSCGEIQSNIPSYERQRMALFVGQCYDDQKIQDAYRILICAGLKINNLSYLNTCLEKLQTEKLARVDADELLTLLLEAFTSDKDREEYQKAVQNLHRNLQLWDSFCLKIKKEINHGNQGMQRVIDLCVKAGYEKELLMLLEWNEAEQCLFTEVHTLETYSECRERVRKYFESVLHYYLCLYGPQFRDREELPAECLSAMLMEEGLQREEEKEVFLKCMKQCAAVHPILSEPVKKLLTLYLEEPKRKEREAREELRKLRSSLMNQVMMLRKNGKRQEALQILQQLRNIIPDDLEIAALILEIRMEQIAG